MDKETEKKLEERGVNVTPVRILVYRCLESSLTPLSLAEIETALESVDKSSISRTLSLFRENHLIHRFNDGSGSVKYELCKSCEAHHDDLHLHFRCERCGSTMCLNEIKVPEVELPKGYKVHERNYIVTGICPECGDKNK